MDDDRIRGHPVPLGVVMRLCMEEEIARVAAVHERGVNIYDGQADTANRAQNATAAAQRIVEHTGHGPHVSARCRKEDEVEPPAPGFDRVSRFGQR